jgi:hypothetical protein
MTIEWTWTASHGVNTPEYQFVRINSSHLELKDNLPDKFEGNKPVYC